MPLISVIVPVCNCVQYISRCLDSILAQTYSNIEIIAVNDGSTDRSQEILDQYASRYEQIKVIRKENGGVTSARLRGIAEAVGEWIGFVDGDDEIETDMFERLFANALTSHAQISHCGYQMHFSDGRVHYFYDTGDRIIQDNITALQELLSGTRIEPSLCSKLFHKSLFDDLLRTVVIPTDIKINEDLLMNYYLFSAAETSVYEDRCLYHYLVRDTSVTRTKRNLSKILDPIKVREIIVKHCPECLKDEANKGYIQACINACNTIASAGFREYREEYRNIRSLLSAKKDTLYLVGNRRRLMALGAIYVPQVYASLYRIYKKLFQKNRYE